MGTSFFKKKIRSWIEKITLASADVKADIQERHKTEFGTSRADYSFGWRDVIETTVSEKKAKGLLLTGAEGSGKHTAAEIAVNMLSGDEYGYEVIYLSGNDFSFSTADIEADEQERQGIIEREDWDVFTDDIVHTFLDNLLNEFYNDERQDNLCIMLENISQCDMSDLIYDRIGRYVRMYDINEDFPDLFVVVIEPDDRYVKGCLRKYLRLMKMSLPNAAQRRQMLINRKIDFETAEAIANHTEGFNYSQLRDLAENINVWHSVDEVSSEFYMDFISTQMPEQVSDEKELIYSEKVQLYQKLGELIDLAPQIIEKMGSNVVYSGVPAVIQQTSGTVSAVTVEKQEEKLENAEDFKKQQKLLEKRSQESQSQIAEESKTMPISDLMKDVFDQEDMNNINNAISNRQRV
ncbi:MAG: ATP-binding protein [Clostridia bacterium]|nr:ATP-binding protein [Clostridia bacterium]